MDVFKKVLKTLLAVGLTWLFIMMIISIVNEIQYSMENDWYGWDIWFISTITFVTIITGGYMILIWYETWFKAIIDKDRAYTMRELTKEFDEIPSGQRKLNALTMWTFNELPYRKRKDILEGIIKEMKE